MITGAHSIIYSRKPDADRAFFRDVLGLPSVDAGDGWLIFGLPPAELAVHPARRNNVHEVYLLCDGIDAFTKAMRKRGIGCSKAKDHGWGVLTRVTLPGGGKLGIYEAHHVRPKGAKKKRAARR